MLKWFSKRFSRNQEGAVLVEALLALPVLTLLTFGILEFGNMMWQRQQLQVGVRDAARYWSRCRPTFHVCDQTRAANIAFFGNPEGTGPLRVPGWDGSPASELTIEPAVPDETPGPSDLVLVEGEVDYQGTPLVDAVLGDSVTIGYWVTMRYLGW